MVQRQLTGSGLPLGMVANAFELGSAQFLRRKSFWSSLWTVDPATKKRFPFRAFWLVSLLSTMLVLVSGPSSAIAVIPTLDYFDLSQPFDKPMMPYYIWNHSTLWPEVVSTASLPTLDLANPQTFCNTTSGSNQCPGYGFPFISEFAWSLLFQSSDTGVNFSIVDDNGDGGRVVATRSCNSTFDGRASSTSINTFLSRALTAYVSESVYCVECPQSVCRNIFKAPDAFPSFSVSANAQSISNYIQWRYARFNNDGTALKSAHPYITLEPSDKVFAPRVETICSSYPNEHFNGQNINVLENITFPTFDSSVSLQVPDWAYKYTRPYLNQPNFTFVEIPTNSGSLVPSLGVVMAIPEIKYPDNDTENPHQTTNTYVCSIYSQWVPIRVWYEPLISSEVSYSITSDMSDSCLKSSGNAKSGEVVINTTIGMDYAKAMDMPVSSRGRNGTFMNLLLQETLSDWSNIVPNGTALQTPTTPFVIPFNESNSNGDSQFVISDVQTEVMTATFLSTIISGLVADGLARIAGNGFTPDSPSFFLLPELNGNGTLQGVFPVSSSLGGHEKSLGTPRPNDAARWLRLNLKFQRYGYGYHWRGSPTAQFGISVLLVHTTVATLYTLYLLSYFKGNRGRGRGLPKAWETIPELFVLAVNSQRSDKLKNTSAGIKELSTWGVRVAVREVEGQKLEIIAGKDEMEELPRARAGVAYG